MPRDLDPDVLIAGLVWLGFRSLRRCCWLTVCPTLRSHHLLLRNILRYVFHFLLCEQAILTVLADILVDLD